MKEGEKREKSAPIGEVEDMNKIDGKMRKGYYPFTPSDVCIPLGMGKMP